tara:strand:- start:290 stop:1123 length:834 start_codon:yes stop_codon:yes gene_type:complete
MAFASHYIKIAGHDVHYWKGGKGFPLLMFHGVGPGTSIMGNFEPVLSPLAERFAIIATDLIGFGESSRKTESPLFDLNLWLQQGAALLNLFPEGPCAVAGHSMGGAIALKIAAVHSQVTHVLTSSTVGTSYPLPPALENFWSLPNDCEELRAAMGAMVHKPEAVTDEMIEGRWKLLSQEGYSDYFREMFAGDRQRFIEESLVTELELDSLNKRGVKISMIHGDNDQPCPAELTSIALSKGLPNAQVTIVPDCGHNLPREKPNAYMTAATELLNWEST